MPYASRDILNYALAIAILILTFFISWILIYVIKIFKEVQNAMHDITAVIKKFNHVLDFTKEKISSAAAIIPVLVKGGEKIFDMVRSIRERSSRNQDRKTKKQK